MPYSKAVLDRPEDLYQRRCVGVLHENGRRIAMRELSLISIILVLSTLGLAGCELVAGIFKAGVWVGVLLVIGIIALIVWMLSKPGG